MYEDLEYIRFMQMQSENKKIRLCKTWVDICLFFALSRLPTCFAVCNSTLHVSQSSLFLLSSMVEHGAGIVSSTIYIWCAAGEKWCIVLNRSMYLTPPLQALLFQLKSHALRIFAPDRIVGTEQFLGSLPTSTHILERSNIFPFSITET